MRFPNAFLLSGPKHISDNLVKSSLEKMNGSLALLDGSLLCFHTFFCFWFRCDTAHKVFHGVIMIWPIQPSRWELFLKQLRDLEKMLVRVMTREQFVSKCVSNPTDAELFKTWSAKLSGLRWEVITKFCGEVSWQSNAATETRQVNHLFVSKIFVCSVQSQSLV